MKKWYNASLGGVDINNRDIYRRLDKEKITMLNNILNKSKRHEISSVLKASKKYRFTLKKRGLKRLVNTGDVEIADLTNDNSRIDRNWWKVG